MLYFSNPLSKLLLGYDFHLKLGLLVVVGCGVDVQAFGRLVFIVLRLGLVLVWFRLLYRVTSGLNSIQPSSGCSHKLFGTRCLAASRLL